MEKKMVTPTRRITLFALFAVFIAILCYVVIPHNEELERPVIEQNSLVNEAENTGDPLLKLSDSEIEDFEDGDGKCGYKLKSTGEVIIPAKYDATWNFREGLAHVRLNGKFGFIDKTGKEVIPLKYDIVDFFNEGLAPVALGAVENLNGKYGFIDKDGNEVIPIKYDFASAFNEGLAVVELNKKIGFIDKADRVVIPLKYDWAYLFAGFIHIAIFVI